MPTEQQVLEKIGEACADNWDQYHGPLLLSNLSPLLTDKLGDYKEALSGHSLKAFIKAKAERAGVRVIEHKVHKPKVGVVPAGEAYEFPESIVALSDSQNATAQDRQKVVLAFLKLIRELPSQDQNRIEIPVAILARLLR